MATITFPSKLRITATIKVAESTIKSALLQQQAGEIDTFSRLAPFNLLMDSNGIATKLDTMGLNRECEGSL